MYDTTKNMIINGEIILPQAIIELLFCVFCVEIEAGFSSTTAYSKNYYGDLNICYPHKLTNTYTFMRPHIYICYVQHIKVQALAKATDYILNYNFYCPYFAFFL